MNRNRIWFNGVTRVIKVQQWVSEWEVNGWNILSKCRSDQLDDVNTPVDETSHVCWEGTASAFAQHLANVEEIT